MLRFNAALLFSLVQKVRAGDLAISDIFQLCGPDKDRLSILYAGEAQLANELTHN